MQLSRTGVIRNRRSVGTDDDDDDEFMRDLWEQYSDDEFMMDLQEQYSSSIRCALGDFAKGSGLVLPAHLGVIDQCCGYSFFRSDR